ncbi:copper chaperone [Arthrobacter woluwensis]|uniref:heavy-metal-associated domain-containing protein n=1 Tax=Arthrobacter woluwensis TaxID=156980 RepID=UPI002784A521|nr:heavy metal-associated domain-containing protein [Arthrobacter woluwensis]MDQ0709920.1 copper chaperone [Arthrobacter woluwensis]
MCDSELRNELTLTPVQESSCSCCAPAAPSPSTDALETAPEQSQPAAQTLDVGVDGLSCGSCVRKVETALSTVDGVESSSVELVPGGTSRLRVSGTAGLSAVRDALASTGFHLSER